MKFFNLKNSLASAVFATAASVGLGLTLGSLAIATSAEAAPAVKLGELSEFKTLATSVLGLVDKGDMTGAVKRIKDLEVAWDGAEAGLKPRSAATWHGVDRAMDHTLTTVRSSHPDPKASSQVLKELLATFEAAK